MKNRFSIIAGVLVLVLTIGLNVRHALNDYGMKDNKLHVEVLALIRTTSTDVGDGYSCSASTNCYDWAGNQTGSVGCTGNTKCERGKSFFGTPYVTCDGKTTSC